MLIKLTRVKIQRPTMTHGHAEQKLKILGDVLINPINIVRVNEAESDVSVSEIIMNSLEAIYVKESLQYIFDSSEEIRLK